MYNPRKRLFYHKIRNCRSCNDSSSSYGGEFEIAICQILREFLPNKYGICRGFVVSSDGEIAGDDIIIFDQERFPTLKLKGVGQYARKEQIPIEAVYAYIEAKHSINLLQKDNNSIFKAIKQVESVKRLCNKREKILSWYAWYVYYR